jgi:hypothetical protein
VGIDSDNGSEFIKSELYRYSLDKKITFTQSRPGNKNDAAHVEQKNWSRVRELVGYHRYDTPRELELLNRIWDLGRSSRTSCCPSKSCSPKPTTAPRSSRNTTDQQPRTNTPSNTPPSGPRPIIALKAQFKKIHAMALSRQIYALTAELETISRHKAGTASTATTSQEARS